MPMPSAQMYCIYVGLLSGILSRQTLRNAPSRLRHLSLKSVSAQHSLIILPWAARNNSGKTEKKKKRNNKKRSTFPRRSHLLPPKTMKSEAELAMLRLDRDINAINLYEALNCLTLRHEYIYTY